MPGACVRVIEGSGASQLRDSSGSHFEPQYLPEYLMRLLVALAFRTGAAPMEGQPGGEIAISRERVGSKRDWALLRPSAVTSAGSYDLFI